MFGFPTTASGIFVTGTSAANFLAMLIARDAALGHAVRKSGLRDGEAQLVAYTSEQVHGCVAQAAEISGIGGRYLRLIPVDACGAIRQDLLASAIAEDRAKGLRPFMVVGTAGTVNAGAIDDLDALANLCAAEQLWFHIDAAFGAFCALSPALKPLILGLERANSLAFDFHKWPQVPYDAGFLLVRDAEAHRRTFANPVAYLQRAPAGLAAGDVWPTDLSPDLSRGFRALKTWFTFRVFGADKIGECIEHTCALAKYLEQQLHRVRAVRTHGPGRAQHRVFQRDECDGRRGQSEDCDRSAGKRRRGAVNDHSRRQDRVARGDRQSSNDQSRHRRFRRGAARLCGALSAWLTKMRLPTGCAARA